MLEVRPGTGPHRHMFRWEAPAVAEGEIPVPPDDAACDCGMTFGTYKAEAISKSLVGSAEIEWEAGEQGKEKTATVRRVR